MDTGVSELIVGLIVAICGLFGWMLAQHKEQKKIAVEEANFKKDVDKRLSSLENFDKQGDFKVQSRLQAIEQRLEQSEDVFVELKEELRHMTKSVSVLNSELLDIGHRQTNTEKAMQLLVERLKEFKDERRVQFEAEMRKWDEQAENTNRMYDLMQTFLQGNGVVHPTPLPQQVVKRSTRKR